MVSGEYKTLKKFVESLSHIKQFWISHFFISIFCTQYCDLKLNIRKIYFACIKKILHCSNCIINVIGLGFLSCLYHQKQAIFRKTSNKHHIYFSLLKKYYNDYYSECTLSLNCLSLRQRFMIRETGVTRGNKFWRKW